MIRLSRDWRNVRSGWIFLTGLALLFAFLYLGSSLFPGAIDPAIKNYFPLALAEKARVYNLPLRVVYICRFILQTVLLSWLLFAPGGKNVFLQLRKISKNYWVTIFLAIMFIWLILQFLLLPFSYYTGFYWQKVWGFSTQSQTAWWADYFKGAGIGLFLYLIEGFGFFFLVNWIPRYWWLAGAAFFSIWLIIEYIFWPILIAPIFNHFEKVTDPAIVTVVDNLAQQAGLNISGVLLMDASRQTTLANAYFTGLGTSKRIVIYDTLLHNYSFPEVKAVIAHEMGHWRYQDVIHGLILGMLGGFAVFGLLKFFLQPWLVKTRQKPPELWAALQLALTLLLFVSSPLQSSVSRGMELRADRFSLELTGNLPAEIQLQQDLAGKSLADLSPPSFIVWFSYDHPPALARIQALEKENYINK